MGDGGAAERRVAPLGWHTQFNVTARQIDEHAALLGCLPTPLVFDHLAHVELPDYQRAAGPADRVGTGHGTGRPYPGSEPGAIVRLPGWIASPYVLATLCRRLAAIAQAHRAASLVYKRDDDFVVVGVHVDKDVQLVRGGCQ